METKELTLERSVITRNRINYILNQLQDVLQETLKPYAGKKVLRNTPYRDWTKQIRSQIDGIIKGYEEEFQVQITWDICIYSVFLSIETTFMVEGRAHYESTSKYICSIEDDVYLTSSFAHCEKSRDDYTVEEVKDAIDKIERLKKEFTDLKSQYREFIK